MQMPIRHNILTLCNFLQLNVKMGTLHEEISVMLNSLEAKSNLLDPQQYEVKDLMSQIMDLKDQLRKEKDEYNVSIFSLTFTPFFLTKCVELY